MRGFTSSFVLSLYGLLHLWPNIQSSRHSLTQDRRQCPTSAADSEETPEVLRLPRPCSEDYQGFCIHGQCIILPDLNTPVCSIGGCHCGCGLQNVMMTLEVWPSECNDDTVGVAFSCPQSYSGERCQHLVLASHSGRADPEKLIAIGVAVALLLCGLTGALYCCVRKRCEK